jgi:hypothetical protein
MKLFPVRISLQRSHERRHFRARFRPSRVTAIAVGVVGLVATVMALPASAATSGSNAATVNLVPPVVRSITVSPAMATFGNCTGGSPSQLAFPNGQCQVGLPSTTGGGVIGGITITNGTTAGHIDVNGQNATPSDMGTPWTLLANNSLTPGADQFLEATATANGAMLIPSPVAPTPSCDNSFSSSGSVASCSAMPGQSSNEALLMTGPSLSTDQNGPFTITTTWTAVP